MQGRAQTTAGTHTGMVPARSQTVDLQPVEFCCQPNTGHEIIILHEYIIFAIGGEVCVRVGHLVLPCP